MLVSHILEDVDNLGPGRRVCVWFVGCGKHCPGCISPEMKNGSAIKISADELAELVNYKVAMTGAAGVTLSGGDPLEQTEIAEFLSLLYVPDVLLFTGFTFKEVEDRGLFEQIKDNIAVLKCGPYVRELDDGHPLMGSRNQTLIYLKPEYREPYECFIREHRRQPVFYRINETIYFSGLPKTDEKKEDKHEYKNRSYQSELAVDTA